ncbi:MAG: polyprenyl synthetase family protein [Acidobacteria bacterium]|nr:polyprenyl synthetase family protein [Acidobacteriota bacterium]MCA1640029.1 polyprenyl synthetase family protein [Acidobacteriota bacterium]
MIEQNRRDEVEGLNLRQYVEKYKPHIEKSLREHLPLAPLKIETKFNEAIEYALFSGGKRLRPILTLLGAELVDGKAEIILPSAVAVEFIHTSSLIFDDLPCMDNANERRGKTSLHEKYGEGLAILVALGFLNASYGLVFVNHSNLPERAMQTHAEIIECVGASGMVGGQSVDLALAKGASSNDFSIDSYNFESVRNLKTSALMRLALRVGAILAGANRLELEHLSRFAELLGNAYQLSDDLIDLEEDGEIFSGNKTFATNQGHDAVRIKLGNLIAEAKGVLVDNFPSNDARNCLTQLTDYLAERKT